MVRMPMVLILGSMGVAITVQAKIVHSRMEDPFIIIIIKIIPNGLAINSFARITE
jgi:hypothetical protein